MKALLITILVKCIELGILIVVGPIWLVRWFWARILECAARVAAAIRMAANFLTK